MNAPTLSLDTPVGQIVAAQPLIARLFERAGIDYCCGGKRSLAEACKAAGLDPKTFILLLETAADAGGVKPAVDPLAMTLTALADHIEATHHAYLREELPALVEKAERVAQKHGGRDARVCAVAETMRELAAEMFSHMAKEEIILFPIVRQLESSGTGAAHCGSIANPIRQMEYEHTSAGDALARLRQLTDNFTPDADACNTHRALLAGLERLELDLHEHVHKENNVLFPRALELEARAVA